MVSKRSCYLKPSPQSSSGDRDNEQEMAVEMVAIVVNNARLQSHLAIENPKEKVFYFLRFYMNLDMGYEEILVNHRIGIKSKSKSQSANPRLIVVKCTLNLHATIFKNVKNLKGKKSHCWDFFFINEQLPDKLSEDREAYEGLKM